MTLMTTMTDLVLDEIHETRRKISERFGGDLRAIVEDARQRQAASGHTTSAPDWQITLTAGSDSIGPAESSETRSVATHVSTP
jgi:hypothetical protein